jgi:hypothetical protein
MPERSIGKNPNPQAKRVLSTSSLKLAAVSQQPNLLKFLRQIIWVHRMGTNLKQWGVFEIRENSI